MIDALKTSARKSLRTLGLRSQVASTESAKPKISFLCNVCGTPCFISTEKMTRESGHCMYCGCYGRLRAMMYALTTRFSPNEIVLSRMTPRKNLRGLGCSDWGYPDLLAEKFDYTDTFYDHEPQLDLCNVDWSRWQPESFDFITCSDVLEHIEPPIDRTFENIYRLLKPGGAAVITVPASLEPKTREHFPDLHDWKIDGQGEKRELVNRRRDGKCERFDDLCFHGGEGMTLEFRLFSRQGIVDSLQQAGLRVAAIHDKPLEAYGIPLNEWSFVLVAEKPAGNEIKHIPSVVDPYRLLDDCREKIAARRDPAVGKDDFERFRYEEFGRWMHIPRWIQQDFSRRAARGERLRCLDVDCAYGTLSLYAKKLLDCDLYAVDHLDRMDRALVEEHGINYLQCNIKSSPLPWGMSYNVIIFADALDRMSWNAPNVLTKLRSLLAPGGRLYLTTPDPARRRRPRFHNGVSRLLMPHSAWRYDEAALDRLIDDAGYRIVRRDYAPGNGDRCINLTLAGT